LSPENRSVTKNSSTEY